MPQYLVVLGREPELSVAELAAVAARRGSPLAFRRVSHAAALIEAEHLLAYAPHLAGTVKLAEVWGSVAKPTQAAVEEFKFPS